MAGNVNRELILKNRLRKTIAHARLQATFNDPTCVGKKDKAI